MEEAKTLAYYNRVAITALNDFIVHDPGAFTIKRVTIVILAQAIS
jgi:hypothetical protein